MQPPEGDYLRTRFLTPSAAAALRRWRGLIEFFETFARYALLRLDVIFFVPPFLVLEQAMMFHLPSNSYSCFDSCKLA